MKRLKKLCLLFVLAVMMLTLISACQSPSIDTPPSTEPSKPIDPNVLSTVPLSQEVCKEISEILNVNLENYPKYSRVPVWYYGTINGCIVTFKQTQLHAESYIRVADCEFRYHSSFLILVYRDGEGCTLEEAYDKGWLNKAHVKQLEERHPKVLEEMEQAYKEWVETQNT